jgi:hypothetical protein
MATALVQSPDVDLRHSRFRLTIRSSTIHRYGVYACEPIPARRKVIEYTGERISRRETKRRGCGAVTYLFTLDDYWTVDGAVGGSGAEIINHSCDPNLYACILRGHILYMSKREIDAELYRISPSTLKSGGQTERGLRWLTSFTDTTWRQG